LSRDKVVTTSLEFPTASQIWHAQERRGARVVHVWAGPDHTIALSRFADEIDDQTAIVSITHVCFRNGAMLDLAPVIELTHSRGALVLVDAYQSVGAVPLDLAHAAPSRSYGHRRRAERSGCGLGGSAVPR
jgi:selenocysteine lyase/cysteine desulfurase